MVIKIKLPVEHFDQRDNSTARFGSGDRQCSLTSHAMMANYLLDGRLHADADRNGHPEPESVYGWNLHKYGDTTDWNAHTKVLKNVYGIETQFKRNGNQRDLIRLLQAGIPVPIGVHYKSSGHVILVVGFEGTLNQYDVPNQGFFWVHDPYGIRSGYSNDYAVRGNHSGAYDKYSVNLMNRLWNSWKNDGWYTEVTGGVDAPTSSAELHSGDSEPVKKSKPSTGLTISQKGIDFIKRWEGLRLNAYLCSAGVWTIGYGSTRGIKEGYTITADKAEQLLKEDLKRFINGVNKHVNVPLSQTQLDVLVSFAFNVGLGAFQNSTLLRLLNQGDYDAVPAQLLRWNKAGGRVVQGLTNRRKAEAQLWKTN